MVLAMVLSLIPAVPSSAAPGGTILNGSMTPPAGTMVPSFLFEPEVPLSSLKTVPTWNELEQLLDNPYLVTLDRRTPGNDQGFPSYRATGILRRPSFGVDLPALLMHPLNYNPTTGEEMRLLNVFYPGTQWSVPFEMVQDPNDPNHYLWTYRLVDVSPGSDRVVETSIDYNSPIARDPQHSIVSVETIPPEGSILTGGDPGEPNYLGFGVLGNVSNLIGYSTPAVRLGPRSSPATVIPADRRLFDPGRGFIEPRNPLTGVGGLRKPSLRVPEVGGSPGSPNFLYNSAAQLAARAAAAGEPVTSAAAFVSPSSENDYVRGTTLAQKTTARAAAMALGKALFWDMQVGSDGVQSCGTCHFAAGIDTRTKNQLNPNHLGPDGTNATFDLHPPNSEVVASDFPFHKLINPEIAGDPAATTPITASVNPGVLENNFPGGVTSFVVADAANIVSDINDVMSSMGVKFGKFFDIPTPGGLASSAFVQLTGNQPRPLMPDLRSPNAADNIDPIAGFNGLRRVEPRNTPTIFAADFNFDNFWDGRARHDFNGGSVFGASDPQSHVFVNNNGLPNGQVVATKQIIRFASLASLATGPALSNFEMSFDGRNWAKIGKKLLQSGVTPLANQLVDPTDSVLGPYSGQRSTVGGPVDRPGRTGLNQTYAQLIRAAYHPRLWSSTGQHLNGAPVPLDQQPPVGDPFDGYQLTTANGPADPANTNQFTQMEANFSLFFGMSVHLWASILVPDNTPLDRFLDANPEAFRSLGEPGEPGLVADLRTIREVGNFKRDPGLTGRLENGATFVSTGTRQPGDPDPLLGMDIFFASNLSLKNPNFRTARCGECHAMPTLTDNTMQFTSKIQLRDFVSEFPPGQPGVEAVLEPLGRNRVISGFLLESEIGENGQDAVERRIINQSLVPNPVDGLAYPDGLLDPDGRDNIPGTADDYINSGQSFFDNGVYDLGVTPIENDIGRGGDDPFGQPLSLAALLLKNLGGQSFEPGAPMTTFDPDLGPEGGLFEETGQDQQINPGFEGDPVNPLLPPYLAPWVNQINVGDSQPELDEVFGGINTLTDVAILEGFVDVLGPINPAGTLNEVYNSATSPLMGCWPDVNRVGRMGSFKAPQLRNVELTGPYFHNGGKLTLRQVVDFYVRGGDFPITNAAHRDFNMVNMNIEVQSNLTEAEKRALVDFLLELTDERVAHEAAPFDRPEMFVPLDGTAPENTFGRPGFLANLANGMFKQIPAVGAAGHPARLPSFLGISRTPVPGPNNDHYDH